MITVPDTTKVRMTAGIGNVMEDNGIPSMILAVAKTRPGAICIDPSTSPASNGQGTCKPAYGDTGRAAYLGYTEQLGGVGDAVQPASGVIFDGFVGVTPGSRVYLDNTGAEANSTASGLTHTSPVSSAEQVSVEDDLGTVSATAAFEFIVPPGCYSLAELDLVVKTTVAADDTNYWTFAAVNKSNASAAMLAATDANTTKLTGGSALTAYTKRSLTLNGTAANLLVNPGDVIEVTATKTAAGANLVELTANVVLNGSPTPAEAVGVGYTDTKIYFYKR